MNLQTFGRLCDEMRRDAIAITCTLGPTRSPQASSLCLIKAPCGWTSDILPKRPIQYCVNDDERSTVSLALIKSNTSILNAYANKLPIMCINVSRLIYTVEAYKVLECFKTYDEYINAALTFYIETDMKLCDRTQQANQRFSNFLHRLRSSGYKEYIFALAQALNMSVDMNYSDSAFVRYKRANIDKTPANGFITALRNGHKWYVKTSRHSLLEIIN